MERKERRGEKEELLRLLTMMGAPEFDAASFGKSGSFEGILENQECMLRNPDENSRETLAYWRERGLVKEIHEADDIGKNGSPICR